MAGGAPRGNNNAKTGTMMRDALRKALKQHPTNEGKRKSALVKVCMAAIDKAQAGDISAFNAIADRLDGKPAQAITGPSGEPISLVERVIVVDRLLERDDPKVIEGEVVDDQLSDNCHKIPVDN